jgi:transposase
MPQSSPDYAPSKPSSRQNQPARSSGFATSLYAERDLVERFFNALKHYRDIATRYDKDRAQLPCRTPSGLRARLAQMTTDPKLASLHC